MPEDRYEELKKQVDDQKEIIDLLAQKLILMEAAMRQAGLALTSPSMSS